MSKTWKKVSMALAALMVAAMMAGCAAPAPADASTAPSADVSSEVSSEPTATTEVTPEPSVAPSEDPSTEPTVDPAASPDASTDPAAGGPIALSDKINVTLPGEVTTTPATEAEGVSTVMATSTTPEGINYAAVCVTSATELTEDQIKAQEESMKLAGDATDVTITGADGTTYTAKEFTATAEGMTTVTRYAVIGNSIVAVTATAPEASIADAKTVMDAAKIEVM